jgi:caffeoyl-CoA O-methyltransferase
MDKRIEEVLSKMAARDVAERGRDMPPLTRMRALHPDAGRLLYILALTSKAHSIIEIGTGMGYSTIWLAMAAQANGGKVITFENEPPRAEQARAYFSESGLESLIDVREGDALSLLPFLRGPVGLLFIDAAKDQYISYLKLCLGTMLPGSIAVADNMLSHEHELAPYKTYVENHPQLTSILVPIGRGLEISVKLHQ